MRRAGILRGVLGSEQSALLDRLEAECLADRGLIPGGPAATGATEALYWAVKKGLVTSPWPSTPLEEPATHGPCGRPARYTAESSDGSETERLNLCEEHHAIYGDGDEIWDAAEGARCEYPVPLVGADNRMEVKRESVSGS